MEKSNVDILINVYFCTPQMKETHTVSDQHWGWINDDRMIIFRWTVTLKVIFLWVSAPLHWVFILRYVREMDKWLCKCVNKLPPIHLSARPGKRSRENAAVNDLMVVFLVLFLSEWKEITETAACVWLRPSGEKSSVWNKRSDFIHSCQKTKTWTYQSHVPTSLRLLRKKASTMFLKGFCVVFKQRFVFWGAVNLTAVTDSWISSLEIFNREKYSP